MLTTIETFFRPLLPIEKPLLVGFSGGEDSQALVLALEKLVIPYELAHFDHGWRNKSAQEAQELKKKARSSFHLMRSKKPFKSELLAREERYAFFENLFKRGQYSALVLAHHQNDQAETVLKRVLEGSPLPKLKGILPISKRGDMPIWRPLLTVSKSAIRAFLQGFECINDPTNQDQKYLRARMRQTILPSLSKAFGKNITPALVRLANYGAELEDYLHEKLAPFSPLSGPFGMMWDFTFAHPFEIRSVLQQTFSISRPIIDQVIEGISSRQANKSVVFGKTDLFIDRGRLFWLKRPLPRFDRTIPLEEGNFEIGDWSFSIRFSQEKASWWEGKFLLDISPGNYLLGPSNGVYRKEWNQNKIPAFLRPCLPILRANGEVVGHFFNQTQGQKKIPKLMSINIEIKQKVCYTDVKG